VVVSFIGGETGVPGENHKAEHLMKRSNHLVRRTFEGHQHDLINRITFRYNRGCVPFSLSQYRCLLLQISIRRQIIFVCRHHYLVSHKKKTEIISNKLWLVGLGNGA
jgi:hypothetical protein